MRYAVTLIVLCVMVFGCSNREQRTRPPISSRRMEEPAVSSNRSPIAAFATRAPFVTGVERAYPDPPSAQVVAVLKSKKAKGETNHFGFLLEYGLRVHWQYLKHTKLSRDLPVESNVMLAELVRLAELPKYTTAHQGGWLNDQFQGEFNETGWSSYQIYVWAKEHRRETLSDTKRFSNSKRIWKMLDRIDSSSLNGIGGGMVCHYGCI